MTIERRRFPRVSVEATDLKLAVTHAKQHEVKILRLVDFSLGGLQVELATGETSPKVGSLLDVALEWPEGAQRFDASVRYVSPASDGRHRVGIEFDDTELVDKLLGAWFRKGA